MEHPNCIECNSDKIISKGVSWLCKDCGRWFSKKRRGQTLMRNLANEVRKIWNRMQKENSPNQVCLGDVVQEILVKHPDLLDRYNLQNITKRDTLTETIWNAIRQNQ